MCRIVDIGNLVCGDQIRSHHVAAHEVFPLGRTKTDRHLAGLNRPLAEIVVDHVAEDVVEGALGSDVDATGL